MRRLVFALVLLPLLLVLGTAHSEDKPDPYAAHVAATPRLAPAEEAKKLKLPPGFEIQLVAAEPDIHKPLNIAFDDRGRLWVSETVEYPFPAPADKKPRDGIKILEDFGPDGRARKITTFADGLNIPIGILPLPGLQPPEAMVFSVALNKSESKGTIYRMTDSKGTGHSDIKKALYTTYGGRDTHGMTNAFTLAFDGWVYACHGFANDSTVKASDGSSVAMNSGNTYRMRPDGSHIELLTRGQVNPFGLSFDPLGNLYSCDCHSQPIYQLLRGGYYPSFGKPNDGLGFAPEMFTNYKGSTAISGIAYYAADQFPAPYRDTVFIGDVVTNQIVQFRLTWQGSTPRATQHDFLVSKDPWFRPVSIQIGPDGALYVADFYNRIIGHYEVPLTHPGRDRDSGRIWRIVYTGKDRGKDRETPAPRADWTQASPSELAQDLAHPNITVRMLAAHELVQRGKKGSQAVCAALTSTSAPTQWVHGLWVLQQLGELDEPHLQQAAQHADRSVRVHLQRILGERGPLSTEEHRLVLAGLKDSDAHVQRAAADALGRHPAAENLRPLLDLRHVVPVADTHLLHVVRMALRDQLMVPAVWSKLPIEPWTERDARAIADVALGVPAPESAAYLLAHVQHYSEPHDSLLAAVHHVARHGDAAVTGRLLAFVRAHQRDDLGLQAELFHAIEHGTQERGGQLSDAIRKWATELTGRLLAATNPGNVQRGIELVGSLKMTEHEARVAEVVVSSSMPAGQREAAMNTLAALDARRHAGVLGRILTDARAPMNLRELAVNLLARANQPETQDQLLQALPTAPARLQTMIAEGLAGSPQGGDRLLSAVAAGKASARLLQDRGVALKLEGAHLPDLKKRIEKLTEGLPPADQRIEDLLRRRREGFLAGKKDPRLGTEVFKKSCAICHQIGGEGARIGPQLDGIGLRGLDRLLEDILDPNRNVDQAFRQSTLMLENGQIVSGLLLRQEGAILVLADAQGKEVRIRKTDVAERSTSQMSPMPANLADQIPENDFYNLLAYLLEQRGKSDRPGGK